MRRIILWLPLLVFLLFLVAVSYRLYRPDDSSIRSRLIDKAVPEFALRPAVPSHPALSSNDLKSGRPRLVNIFASWCQPCMIEAPQLMELSRRGVPIDAIAIRDREEDVAAFLRRFGDPFQRIGADPASQVQMALGSAGVPETFIVDGSGIVRYQHIGVINAVDVPDILAAYEAAR